MESVTYSDLSDMAGERERGTLMMSLLSYPAPLYSFLEQLCALCIFSMLLNC